MNSIYFNELKRLKPITDEEIKQLYSRIHQGDTTAINNVIEANLRLVYSIANLYKPKIKHSNKIELDDLIAEGNFGLIKAAYKFNVVFGVRFSTYANYWIKKYINAFIATNDDVVSVPQSLSTSNRKIAKLVSEIAQTIQSEVTREHIELLDLFTANELDYYFTPQRTISTDYDTNMNLEDLIEVSDINEQLEQKRKITLALKYLTPKERMIIKMSFGIDQDVVPQSEIWNVLGITRQWATILKNRAFIKLKDRLKHVY